MKAGSYFLVATFMAVVVTLFLTASPASAWPDNTMPHFGKTTPPNTCANDHMINGQRIGAAYTFMLCKANSQANNWAAFIKRVNGPTICSVPMQAVPPSGTRTFPCSPIPAGTYTATILYTVPGDNTQYSQTDQYYLAP
jgi:hypothetical protein